MTVTAQATCESRRSRRRWVGFPAPRAPGRARLRALRARAPGRVAMEGGAPPTKSGRLVHGTAASGAIVLQYAPTRIKNAGAVLVARHLPSVLVPVTHTDPIPGIVSQGRQSQTAMAFFHVSQP